MELMPEYKRPQKLTYPLHHVRTVGEKVISEPERVLTRHLAMLLPLLDFSAFAVVIHAFVLFISRPFYKQREQMKVFSSSFRWGA